MYITNNKSPPPKKADGKIISFAISQHLKNVMSLVADYHVLGNVSKLEEFFEWTEFFN